MLALLVAPMVLLVAAHVGVARRLGGRVATGGQVLTLLVAPMGGAASGCACGCGAAARGRAAHGGQLLTLLVAPIVVLLVAVRAGVARRLRGRALIEGGCRRCWWRRRRCC